MLILLEPGAVHTPGLASPGFDSCQEWDTFYLPQNVQTTS